MKSLPLTTQHFLRLEVAFGEWLRALGYATTTAYYAPLAVREFLAYLEQRGLPGLHAVDTEVVAIHFARLAARDNKRCGGGLSRAYLNKHRQALRLFARYLTESGQDTFAVPTEVKRKPPVETEAAVLTRAEIEALYAACADDVFGLRDRAMLALFYGCGLRRSEGVRLDVGDVLIHRGMLHVRHGKNYRERYVPLAEGVSRDLTAYLEEARTWLLKPSASKPTERAVLVSQRGSRITGQSLLLRLHTLCEHAAQDEPTLAAKTIGLHTLRYAIATHLLLSGMALHEIAQFLGHASLESTQRYTHLAHTLRAGKRREEGVVHVVAEMPEAVSSERLEEMPA